MLWVIGQCEFRISGLKTVTFSAQSTILVFYVNVTVHRNKFLYNKTNQMQQFHKFILA